MRYYFVVLIKRENILEILHYSKNPLLIKFITANLSLQ